MSKSKAYNNFVKSHRVPYHIKSLETKDLDFKPIVLHKIEPKKKVRTPLAFVIEPDPVDVVLKDIIDDIQEEE